MARSGLNCTLSYNKGKATHTYQVRCNLLAHGTSLVYTESSARVRRVLYPHRQSVSNFQVGVELNGEDEFVSLSNWLAGYVDYALNLDLSSPYGLISPITVVVPTRRFSKQGIPLQGGFEWGDAVGLMVRSETLVFAEVGNPADMVNKKPTSKEHNSPNAVDAAYFYPSVVSLRGSAGEPGADFYRTLAGISYVSTGNTQPDGTPSPWKNKPVPYDPNY